MEAGAGQQGSRRDQRSWDRRDGEASVTTTQLCAGLEGLLREGGNSKGLARTGSVDTPPDAGHPTEAMAARHDRISRASGKRCKAGCCADGGRQYAPLVAQQRHTAERSPRSKLGRSTGHPPSLLTSTPRTAGCGPACPLVWQGRRGDSPPYADRVLKLAGQPIRVADPTPMRTTRIHHANTEMYPELRLTPATVARPIPMTTRHQMVMMSMELARA